MRTVTATWVALLLVSMLTGCERYVGEGVGAGPGATAAETSDVASPPAEAPEPEPIGDADEQGFRDFGGKARCYGLDRAELFLRTDESALVVCRSEIDRLYYRGYRVADGAAIDLYDVEPQGNGFVAFNTPDNARYVITPDGFQLIQNDAVVTSESAVEVGPVTEARGTPPNAAGGDHDAEPGPVVLGSAADMGPASVGYGTERPTVFSMGSCPNAVSKITWQDWGAPVARGTGLGCVQTGQPPRYELEASDVGSCHGVVAYRTLRIATSVNDICPDGRPAG